MSDFIRAVGDTLTFYARTHALAGGHVDADSLPTWKIYEDETGTAILTGTMAKIDDAGTTGKYSEQVVLSEANGFEYLKDYSIDILAIVGGVTDGFSYSLHMGRLTIRDNLQLDEGTAQGYSANTLQARAGAPVIPVGARVFVESATTGALQESTVSAWVDGTKTATVDPPWPTTLTGTVKYRFFSGSAAPTANPIDVELTATSRAAIVNEVWDEDVTTGHAVANSAAVKLVGAGDPLSSPVPGSYGAGTAGFKIGSLPTDPADASDIATLFVTNATSVGILNTSLNNLISTASAIRARTDQLTFTVAGQVDINPDMVFNEIIEGARTFQELLRLYNGVLLGESSGQGTTLVKYRDLADSVDRVTSTMDASNNRTAVTLNPS